MADEPPPGPMLLTRQVSQPTRRCACSTHPEAPTAAIIRATSPGATTTSLSVPCSVVVGPKPPSAPADAAERQVSMSCRTMSKLSWIVPGVTALKYASRTAPKADSMAKGTEASTAISSQRLTSHDLDTIWPTPWRDAARKPNGAAEGVAAETAFGLAVKGGGPRTRLMSHVAVVIVGV